VDAPGAALLQEQRKQFESERFLADRVSDAEAARLPVARDAIDEAADLLSSFAREKIRNIEEAHHIDAAQHAVVQVRSDQQPWLWKFDAVRDAGGEHHGLIRAGDETNAVLELAIVVASNRHQHH